MEASAAGPEASVSSPAAGPSPSPSVAAAAAWTCLSCSGNGKGVSSGLDSASPTQLYREKTMAESNQSSSCRRSRDLMFREKYRVARLRTMVPTSLSRPRPGYSMYITGFCVSSFASDPRRPSLSVASCPGKMVM